VRASLLFLALNFSESSIVDFQMSDAIAIGSLIVAVMAYRHTLRSARDNSIQIQEISKQHLRLSSATSIGAASQKYVILLSAVRREFEDIMEKLAYQAFDSGRKIGRAFDEFDTQGQVHPFLRHEFDKCVWHVRRAYDKELVYQSGLNLALRFRSLKDIKESLASYEFELAQRGILSFLKRQKNRTFQRMSSTHQRHSGGQSKQSIAEFHKIKRQIFLIEFFLMLTITRFYKAHLETG
jgi:hypothetical protein